MKVNKIYAEFTLRCDKAIMETNTSYLIELAKDTSDLGRAKLVGKTAEQLLNQARDFTDAELSLFGDIFAKLYKFTPADTKEKLSSAIAMSDWAPHSLIRVIAMDDENIAGPVLSFSPVIKEELLEEVVKTGSKSHQIRIAQRPFIGQNVSNALVDGNHLEVIAALSKNLTANISETDLIKALQLAKDNPSIIDNFVSRSDASEQIVEIATKLGSTLAREIAKRQSSKSVATPVDRAINPDFDGIESFFKQEDEIQETPKKIYKQVVSVLDPKDLMRELQSGQKSIFIKQVAGYIGTDNGEIINCLRKQKIESFALLARAIGFEANQVQTMVKELDFGGPEWRDEFNKLIVGIWLNNPPDAALEKFRNQL